MERRHFLKTAAATASGALLTACGESEAQEKPAIGACSRLATIPAAEPAIIGPDEGEVIPDGDGRYKIRAAQLGNYWSMMELTLAPRQLLAPHTHDDYDQAVYLIEGELGFEFGGEGGTVLSGGAGSYVIKPRGLSHTFWNPGDTPVRYIEMSANVTFERFVDSVQGVDDMREIDAAAKEHGVEFHYDQIARLMLQHGLTSVKGSAIHLPRLDELDLPGRPPRP